MTHDANPTAILHTILENIAYEKESNDVTLAICSISVNRYTNGTTNTALIQESSDGIIPRTSSNLIEGLLAMKTIEDVKRELRKALGLDPLDKTFDKTKFKVQSDKSKTIGGAAKLIDWKK